MDSTNNLGNNVEQVDSKPPITIYCHFSFKRPKNASEPYGLFAAALYSDFAGKKLIIYKTKKLELWQDHQFITAIQSYENALSTIYEYQSRMLGVNIRQIMLVTDNSTLAGWIENPKKNKNYTAWMQKAVSQYRIGAPKEICIGIGLCEAREAEKSYKYCKENLVSNDYEATKKRDTRGKEYKFNIGTVGKVMSADDIVRDNSIKTTGISEIQR